MTVIQIINEVQNQLRLPKSTLVSEAHAALLLSFINKVQRDFMMESAVWDECKVYDHFHTVDGTPTYDLVITSYEVDSIRNLEIPGYDPIISKDDETFRILRKGYTSSLGVVGEGQPLYYRIRSRDKSIGAITIELLPTPDAIYQVDYELLKKPLRLTLATETPLLDADTIVAGTLMLAKIEQGEDATTELAAFQAKLGLESQNYGESNWGDVNTQ